MKVEFLMLYWIEKTIFYLLNVIYISYRILSYMFLIAQSYSLRVSLNIFQYGDAYGHKIVILLDHLMDCYRNIWNTNGSIQIERK